MTTLPESGLFLYCITNDVNDKVYIGQTSNPAKRWRYHTNIGRYVNVKRRQPVQSAMLKYGVDKFHFELVGEFNTQQELDDAEIAAIACHGRSLKACTYNLAPGGRKGGSGPLSAAARQKISQKSKGRKLSAVARKKLSDSRKKYYETHDGPWKGKRMPGEMKERIAAKLRGHRITDEQRRTQRDRIAALPHEQVMARLHKAWAARAKLYPQITDKMKEASIRFHTGAKRSAETCAKIAAKAQERWTKIRAGELPRPPDPPRCENDPEYLRKMSEGLKKSWERRCAEDPDYKQKAGEKAKQAWSKRPKNDPDNRRKRSEAAKKAWAKRCEEDPDARRKRSEAMKRARAKQKAEKLMLGSQLVQGPCAGRYRETE